MYCICINTYMEVHAVFMSRKYMYMYRNYGTQFFQWFCVKGDIQHYLVAFFVLLH